MRADNLNVILHNMARNPDDWRLDEFHAHHKSGVNIWIGNGVFGRAVFFLFGLITA